MHIELDRIQESFASAQESRKSRHSVLDRTHPSLLQYDYLALSTLSADVRGLIAQLPDAHDGKALDLGADKSPYRNLLEAKGYEVETLDVAPDSGADHTGTAERTNLPDAAFDLVICTQVLEHCDEPWDAIREIRRIVKPGGRVIVSVPHVWFYHPHPKDHWRFTQEGLVKLCRHGGLKPEVLLAQGGSVLAIAQIVNFLVYGVLGKLGSPVYGLVNLLGRVVDRVLPNDLFCHNFACLAEPAAAIGAPSGNGGPTAGSAT
jgi:SAM-dependent methyltransferase